MKDFAFQLSLSLGREFDRGFVPSAKRLIPAAFNPIIAIEQRRAFGKTAKNTESWEIERRRSEIPPSVCLSALISYDQAHFLAQINFVPSGLHPGHSEAKDNDSLTWQYSLRPSPLFCHEYATETEFDF